MPCCTVPHAKIDLRFIRFLRLLAFWPSKFKKLAFKKSFKERFAFEVISDALECTCWFEGLASVIRVKLCPNSKIFRSDINLN